MSNAIVNGMAGAGGGIIAQIITYPLQTVNTRQQTERVAKKDSIQSPSTRPHRSTLVQIFQVIRNEGLGGLYSGLKPSLLGTAASQGIYYSFYQAFKNKAEAIASANKRKGLGDGSPGMLSWLVVAALAGSVNVLLTNPIWVLVTRMQTHTQAERKIVEAKKEALIKEASGNVLSDSSLSDQLALLDSIKPRPYGTFQAACEVYNESGIAGFWKGLVPTLIMVCNPSIQFMIYETLLKHLRTRRAAKRQGSKNVTALEISYFIPVKNNTQRISLIKTSSKAGNWWKFVIKIFRIRYSTGTLDAIIKMIRYEGVSSFYKGMSTKIVQSVFAASVLFMVKEELVKAYALFSEKGRLKSVR
ncbi:Peroxisomal nicotinamide adenine dinucleotide carrier [Sesamum angolense]|uniref:Peroxisomal nicotinamide adenine dinucleotide carrier n=1 Tax=Sesamum angolense TaxID=2727404 RepID=A0AAE2C4C3_9LAMI|nr:Peroxisomal nicotinamide adenine dinucleotide carrier [Sesamum angolense]